MSTDLYVALESLASLDEHPWCEWEGAETVHGQGEAAVAISHLPCTSCGHTERTLIGDACIAMMHRVQREIPDLTYACYHCEQPTQFAAMSITFI